MRMAMFLQRLPYGHQHQNEGTMRANPWSEPIPLLVWTAPDGINWARMRSLQSLRQRRPSVDQIGRIGMDTSKHISQLHGVNTADAPALRKKLGARIW
jgi:hypothetical protein